MKDYTKKIKDHFKEVLKTKKGEKSIALGFAIGTLIAILPTYGFSILLGLLVVLIFKKISKISLFVGLAFWNPLILTPLYMLSYRIGDYLCRNSAILNNITLFDKIYNFSRRFLIGNLIIAFSLSFISYFLVNGLLKAYKKNHFVDE
jgi:uncharacterized protein